MNTHQSSTGTPLLARASSAQRVDGCCGGCPSLQRISADSTVASPTTQHQRNRLEQVKDIIGHLDTAHDWRDREGDVWRYTDGVGWTWSRDRATEQVLDEPGIPSYADGPFSEVGLAPTPKQPSAE